jgi:hypothetical protein
MENIGDEMEPFGPLWRWKLAGEAGKLVLWAQVKESRRRRFEEIVWCESTVVDAFGGREEISKTTLISRIFTHSLAYVFFVMEDEDFAANRVALLVPHIDLTLDWVASFARQAERRGDRILCPSYIIRLPDRITWFGGDDFFAVGNRPVTMGREFQPVHPDRRPPGFDDPDSINYDDKRVQKIIDAVELEGYDEPTPRSLEELEEYQKEKDRLRALLRSHIN